METLTISHWRRVSAFRRLDWEGALVSPSMRLIGRRHPLFPHPASVGRGLPGGSIGPALCAGTKQFVYVPLP